jgi:peptide/nickel transport system permease protein
LPIAAIALAQLGFVSASSRSPTRMMLDLSWAPPSQALPFGAGEGGVDLLALVVHASTRALALAVVVSCFGLAVGTALGTAAGLARGSFARAALAACDLVQSFPSFLLALAILSVVRAPSRLHIGLVFALTAWAPFARLSLVQARVLADAQFVDAARALGASSSRVALRHVLPNLFGPVAVQLGTSAAAIVLGETALGFVGLGPRDGVSLGAILEQGTVAMLRAPHVLVFGAIAVALLSGALQLASEALRARFGLRGTDGA